MSLNTLGITVLRPDETSFDTFFDLREVEIGYNELETRTEESVGYNERLDDWIDISTDTLREKADTLEVPIKIREHQLSKNIDVPGYKATRGIKERTQLLVAINAEMKLLGYMIALMRDNPLVRAILHYDRRYNVEDMYEILGHVRSRISLLDSSGTLTEIPRFFIGAVDDTKRAAAIAEQGLKFPNVKPVSNSTTGIITTLTSRSIEKEFQEEHMRSEDTNAPGEIIWHSTDYKPDDLI